VGALFFTGGGTKLEPAARKKSGGGKGMRTRPSDLNNLCSLPPFWVEIKKDLRWHIYRS